METKVNIRPAMAEDSERIAELLLYIADYHGRRRPDIYREGAASKHGADDVRAIIADERNDVLAAVVNGELMGYTISKVKTVNESSLLRRRTIYYIDDFCVDPRSQRLGIGRALFAAAKERARELSCNMLELNVWECNPEAIAFYEACGMKTQRRQMEMTL